MRICAPALRACRMLSDMNIGDSKAALRKKYLAMRKTLPHRKLRLADIMRIEGFNAAEVIFCYVSFGSEIETHLLIDELLANGKTVAVPRCDDLSGNMSAVAIDSPAALSPGSFGIPEPQGTPIDKKTIDAAIVPGAAFDKSGFRLGYGKGYYDRFLADISPLTVGVCHRELLTEALPHSEHDIKLDYVISL